MSVWKLLIIDTLNKNYLISPLIDVINEEVVDILNMTSRLEVWN